MASELISSEHSIRYESSMHVVDYCLGLILPALAQPLRLYRSSSYTMSGNRFQLTIAQMMLLRLRNLEPRASALMAPLIGC